jgi:16S rRNA G527 N7-methylase RsmG
MAILNPDASFTLLDSNRKKMAIISEIASPAVLNLTNVQVSSKCAKTCMCDRMYECTVDCMYARGHIYIIYMYT